MSSSTRDLRALLARPLASRQRACLAFSMSLICPGWGHVYAGAPGRAVQALLLAAVFVVPGVAVICAALVHSPFTAVTTGVATFLLLLAIPVDAARAARRSSAKRSRSWGHLGLHVAFVPLALAILSGELAWIRAGFLHLFETPTSSMAPNLVPGDLFLVDVRPRTSDSLRLGDVIVFEAPRSSRLPYVKRVVGLPGNRVAIHGGRLLVDGRVRTFPSAQRAGASLGVERVGGRAYAVEVESPARRSEFGPVVVPAGHVFVLGDSRFRSVDSRNFGFVPLSDVRGRVLHILWSWDRQARRLRWERLGSAFSTIWDLGRGRNGPLGS